jgi:hypothetical protein
MNEDRVRIGIERAASTSLKDLCWDEVARPSPSVGPGMCVWCGSELDDVLSEHCPTGSGCRFAQWTEHVHVLKKRL